MMRRPYTAARARATLSAINRQDIQFLSLPVSPQSMIISVLPVVPTTVRPIVMLGATSRNVDHHITGRYARISVWNDTIYDWVLENTEHGRRMAESAAEAGVPPPMAEVNHAEYMLRQCSVEDMEQFFMSSGPALLAYRELQKMCAVIIDNSGDVIPKAKTQRSTCAPACRLTV